MIAAIRSSGSGLLNQLRRKGRGLFAESRSKVGHRQFGANLQIQNVGLIFCCVVCLLSFCGSNGFAQSNGLQAAWQKKPFGNAYSRERTWPKIENGYLISFRRSATNDAPDDMVDLISLASNQETKLRFWLNGASTMWLNDATVTPSQHVLIAGSFLRGGNDTTNNFITELDNRGQILTTVDLGAYQPGEICAGNDGSIWTVGHDWKAEAAKTPYDLLRNYSSGGQLLRSYLRRSDLRVDKLDLSMRYEGRTPGRIILQCGEMSVGAYIGPAMTWTEVKLNDGTAQTWRMIPPALNVRVSGVALSGLHQVFASFITILGADKSTYQKGLYMLNINEGRPTADWQPVVGTVSPLATKYAFQKLVGSDGTSLVYLGQSATPDGDGWFLFWSKH